MHLFDIRRSNSVTELWKKFEDPAYSQGAQAAEGQTTSVEFTQASPGYEEVTSDPNNGEVMAKRDGGSQPLLAAFETEMAKLLNAAEGPGVEQSQRNTSASAGVQPEPTRPGRVQNPADAFAQAINNIVDGAEMVRDEVRARIPDFERQLQNAQRALPEQVGTTLQMALTTLESHVRNLASALNNISIPPGQRARPSAASHTVDGLRAMASEIGQLGQTLFAAFEHEFGRLPSVGPNQIINQGITPPATTNNQERNGTTGVTAADTEDPQPGHRHNIPFDNEKDTFISNNSEANKPIAQSDKVARERNPAFSRPYNSRFLDPQQHNIVPPSSFAADRRNAAMSSHTNQPFRNLPFRHPSHHQQIIHPPPFPPPCFPSIAPPPQLYAAPPAPPKVIPPFWYTEQPPVHIQQPTAGVSLANQSNGTSMRTNSYPRDEHDIQAHRSANKILFVGNVGFDVSESMIQTVFASKGFLVDANLPLDSQTGKHAGFGYLQFASTHAARAALEALQGTHIDGHSINLEFSDCSPITGLYPSHRNQEASQSRPKQVTGSISQSPRDLFLSKDNTSIQPKKSSLKEQNGKRKEHSSSDHRKSLAFRDPIPLPNTKTDPGSSNPRALNKSPSMDALLDQDSGDSDFAARYPSLLPDLSTERSHLGNSTCADLLNMSPELEMRRFPPVSQLDAHALANRQQKTQPTPGASTTGSKVNYRKRAERENVPGSFPLSDNPADLERFQASLNSLDNPPRGLRRSNTMMPVNPSARLLGPFDPLAPEETGGPIKSLRRSATQREPLRDAVDSNRDLIRSRRPFPLSSPPARHPQPGSHRDHRSLPVEDLQQSQETSASSASKSRDPEHSRADSDECSIPSCVTTLLDLGYGGVRDGGPSRITMYAEVARGSVLEAIEMIEEERKAYEQSPSMK